MKEKESLSQFEKLKEAINESFPEGEVEIKIQKEHQDCGTAEFTIFVLRCLLNYHERMMAGAENLRVELRDYPEQEPPTVKDVYQGWADGLKEAIRCVKLVHGIKEPSESVKRADAPAVTCPSEEL